MISPQAIGRYQIKSELGHGGMATVYKAYDDRFKRDVAIKVLPHQFLNDPIFRARFEREAQTIAALEHPAIVPVYDFGEEDAQPYLVMRFMAGGTLSAHLAKGALPVARVATIFQRICSALDEAHDNQVIHRDLKPANILFDARGDSFLSDFGIAKIANDSTGLTIEGMSIGTAEYMSPEQTEGTQIDTRTDIYSLGAVLFHLLTGQLPYQAKTITGLMLAHVTKPVPQILKANPDLPPACEEIIVRAMAKDPRERYARAGEIALALTTIVRNETVLSAEVDFKVSSPSIQAEEAEFDDGLTIQIEPGSDDDGSDDSTIIIPASSMPEEDSDEKVSSKTILSAKSLSRAKSGLFNIVKKGIGQKIDQLKETTIFHSSPTTSTQADGSPAPYCLTGQLCAMSPEELPELCDKAWKEAFQGFKSGAIEEWLTLWKNFYWARGESKQAELCRSYLAYSTDYRKQLHFKNAIAQQLIFESFLQQLGSSPPEIAIQPISMDLGELICTKVGRRQIELRHTGSRGLLNVEVTADVSWLEIAGGQTSRLLSIMQMDKDDTFYLYPGEIAYMTVTAHTASLKGGDYNGRILVSPNGGEEKIISVKLSVNVDSLLDSDYHQTAISSQETCRKILRVEPDRLRVKFMLARAVTELGHQLTGHMPKQALTYAQEAQELLETITQAGDAAITPEEINDLKEDLTKLWAKLNNVSALKSELNID